MRKENIHDFIKKRKYLIWYTNNWDGLNDESIVEAVLNYGDWEDVQKMIEILGMKRVASIFRAKTDPSLMRCNYHPKTKYYFNLYFNKYDPQGNIDQRTTRVTASRGDVFSKF
jgi:hypothetical protein